MTFADPGALLAAVYLAVVLLGVYVLFLMAWEGVAGLRRTVAMLRGDRRGDTR